jgi:hypothetical protein
VAIFVIASAIKVPVMDWNEVRRSPWCETAEPLDLSEMCWRVKGPSGKAASAAGGNELRMTEERIAIRLIVIVVSFFLLWWQARWLLRAYRRERDRQPPERRSSRVMLAAQASLLFTALSMVFGIYTARRFALGAVAISTLVEVVRRRFTSSR